MSTFEEKWNFKFETSLAELFKPDWSIPHPAILAIAKELEKTMGKQKVIELIKKVGEKFALEQAKQMTENATIDTFEDFLKFFEKSSEEYWWNKLNIDEPAVITENSRKVNTVGCIHADIWRDWGEPEYGYAYHCHQDFAFIKAMFPKIKFERTKSLMMGDEHCNYSYTWIEDE